MTIISAVFLADSTGIPCPRVSFLNRRFPASRIRTSNPSERSSSITVAFRARPPRGLFFQPQGSVSPCTLAVLTIRIFLDSVASKSPVWKRKNVIIQNILFIQIPYLQIKPIFTFNYKSHT